MSHPVDNNRCWTVVNSDPEYSELFASMLDFHYTELNRQCREQGVINGVEQFKEFFNPEAVALTAVNHMIDHIDYYTYLICHKPSIDWQYDAENKRYTKSVSVVNLIIVYVVEAVKYDEMELWMPYIKIINTETRDVQTRNDDLHPFVKPKFAINALEKIMEVQLS